MRLVQAGCLLHTWQLKWNKKPLKQKKVIHFFPEAAVDGALIWMLVSGPKLLSATVSQSSPPSHVNPDVIALRQRREMPIAQKKVWLRDPKMDEDTSVCLIY